MYIIILIITGIAVGFASGLLGVGGCFIMIPVQFWVLES
ncbi:MAG: sulfite exporter TauE/SafE family protein, partial [Candidatus Helarchaeota archaeon]